MTEFRNHNNVYTLDYKRGDVTGDGVEDDVYITGHKPDGAAGIYADDITLIVEDGRDHSIQAIKPAMGAGYNARLFLGDFNGDHTDDILLSIDTGGSGGYGIYYIFTFKNFVFRELFDAEQYNNAYKYRVDYDDFYRVSVGNITLNKLFILDISTRGTEYLSQFYREGGKLKGPVQGEVLALGALFPVMTDDRTNTYDLLAFRRIVGTTNADTLGYMEDMLHWDGQQFGTRYLAASIPGTNLTALY